MSIRFSILFFLLLLSLTASANDYSTNYNDNKKGFYYYDPLEKEKEKEKDIQHLPSEVESKDPKDTKNVIINSAWIKENMPRLTQQAVDNPTDENLGIYYYIQRLTMDLGSRFSKRTKEFFMKEPALNEDLRRPTNASSLLARKDEINDARENLLKGLVDQIGIFFFYRSDCPYCHKQSFSMAHMKKHLGIEVLGVSMDNKKLDAPRSDEYPHRPDNNLVLSKKYNIERTPTLLVVDLKTGEAIPIAFGLTDYKTIVDRTLIVSEQAGFITKEQMDDARDVKDIVALEDQDIGISLNKEEFEKNPQVLVELLRERLKQQSKTGSY